MRHKTQLSLALLRAVTNKSLDRLDDADPDEAHIASLLIQLRVALDEILARAEGTVAGGHHQQPLLQDDELLRLVD